MFEVEKKTKLQTVPQEDIKSVLNWKIEEAKEKGLPIEETIADYIALSAQNIDDKVKQLTAYKKEIQDTIGTLKQHKAEAMQECNSFLVEDLGVDKLKGLFCSSITVKPKDISITKKFVLDVSQDKLVEMNLAHYEESIKEILATIKINKKRSKDENK